MKFLRFFGNFTSFLERRNTYGLYFQRLTGHNINVAWQVIDIHEDSSNIIMVDFQIFICTHFAVQLSSSVKHFYMDRVNEQI
jgi:hypothetical protein